ncbi:hypothetical protein E5S67_00648 [Microcoleus sp. IPMA8]|uniref:Uncharacterized protein n=1 Tax=Microcoleus asticus IPMA8 TaxID=2563858 RepID=A0ABX2CRV2_9CYAN|nr:hypothetical protein [Microcoleus asticus]NQE32931.1 hypothetical protein [Microcoleus asticus IPMA8]
MIVYLGSDGDRAQFRLLKGSPQRALYFTGVRVIGFGRSTIAAQANRTMPKTILDFRF